MKTTNKTVIKALQQRIFRITDGIQAPPETRNHFLDIMAIRMGRKNPLYLEALQMVAEKPKQIELLSADDKHELKKDFERFCHMILKGYIKQESEINSFGEYFDELEYCSQKTGSLMDYSRLNFLTLRDMEKKICEQILSCSETITPYAYRRLLTAWLMFPELIFFPEQISDILKLFEEKVLQL